MKAARTMATVLALAIAASGLYLAGSRLLAPELDQVTIATYREPGSLPVWVAQELDLFRSRGLQVEILEFSGGGLSSQVLREGGADIGGMPTGLALQLAEEGEALKLVHPTADLLPGTTRLLVRRDLQVELLEDLQGLRVGFDDLAPSCLPCMAFRRVLSSSGVEAVQVALPNYKAQEALTAGTVDAAVVSQPFSTFITEAGVAIPLLDVRLGPEGDAAALTFGSAPAAGGDSVWLGASSYWAMESLLEARPAVVRRVAEAIADAAAWLRDPLNRLRAQEVLIRYAGGLGSPAFFEASARAVLATMDWRSYPAGYTDWLGLQRQADVMANLGLLNTGFDVRPLVSSPWFQP